jgi:hypothetical protein
MSDPTVSLGMQWLAEQEVPMPAPGERCFLLRHAGEDYYLGVTHLPASAVENFTHVEQLAEDPADEVVLGLIARAFLASLPREGGTR